MDPVAFAHVGHAENLAEGVLLVIGLVLTLVAVAVALLAFWPRPAGRRRVRRKALHTEEPGMAAVEADANSPPRP